MLRKLNNQNNSKSLNNTTQSPLRLIDDLQQLTAIHCKTEINYLSINLFSLIIIMIIII